MKWHLTVNELPEERRLVIIYVPNRPWDWDGKGDIHYDIAWLTKDISGEVSYYWETFGPDRYLEEEVVAWSYFEEYKEYEEQFMKGN